MTGYAGDRTATIALTGGLDALNTALAAQNVRYQGNANFNSRNRAPDATNPTDNTGATDTVPNDTLTITINDLLNTDILNRDTNPGNNVTTAGADRAEHGEHHSESEAGHAGGADRCRDRKWRTRIPSWRCRRSACSTWTCGVATTDPNAFKYVPDWTGTVTLTVNHGTLRLNDPLGVVYTGDGTRTIMLTGGLGALNNALRNQNVRYLGDQDFNTGTLPELLATITIDDLATPTFSTEMPISRTIVPARTETALVSIIVNPTNDKPQMLVPAGINVVINEDDLNGVVVKRAGSNPSDYITVGGSGRRSRPPRHAAAADA